MSEISRTAGSSDVIFRTLDLYTMSSESRCALVEGVGSDVHDGRLWSMQGRPLGGASGALVPGADFEGALKRQSPTGHTMVISSFANDKSRKGFFCIWLYWL
jgi:hypothetical protein